ncbi:MAG: hypothetical protein AB1782_09910 [Cyanobacteriota bacterium]
MLSPLSNNLNITPDKNRVSFGAGKVYLWFDNDGTFIPYRNRTELNSQVTKQGGRKALSKRFNRFREFLEKSQGTVQLNISTGQNISKFLNVIANLNSKCHFYVLPEKVAVNDGGDLFEIAREEVNPVAKDNENALNRIKKMFGFIIGKGNTDRKESARFQNYSLNLDKRQEIIDKTNWNYQFIKDTVTKALNDKGFRVFDESKDFGSEGIGKLKDFRKKHQRGNVAVIIDGGEFNFFIRLLPEEGSHFSHHNLSVINNDIRTALYERNIKFSLKKNLKDNANAFMPTLRIVPIIDNMPVSKAYDITKIVKKAKEENDLVIVAGDGDNDIRMLNPDTYQNIVPREELPLRGIAITHPTKFHNSRDLLNLARKKENKEFITISTPEALLSTVKRTIRAYAEKNPEFKQALNPNVAQDIIKTTLQSDLNETLKLNNTDNETEIFTFDI